VTDAKKGAFFALASSLLVALLFAYIFRIPIPMGGYIGPFGVISTYGMPIVDVLLSVLVAWVFKGNDYFDEIFSSGNKKLLKEVD